MNTILPIDNTKMFIYYEGCLEKIDSGVQRNANAIQIYCVGTPLYKGVSYDSVFEEIIYDFFDERMIFEELKGNFLILIVRDNVVKVLSDRTMQHHLFYDATNKVLSTSFLALVDLNRANLEVNHYGFYEKIAIGFHLGEKTLFNNIIRISPDNTDKVDAFNVRYLSEHTLQAPNNIKFHSNGRKDSLKRQEQSLDKYFRLINKTFSDKVGDLGMSGGFDCRLILSLAQKNLNKLLHLHTHATKGVHEGQSYIADKLAKEYGVELTRVETEPPLQLNNTSFTEMLDGNLKFFDARSARHLGAYSQTYTKKYRIESMGRAYYSLNGLGGEIYRDSYFTGSKKMGWDEWAERYLFLEGAKAVVPRNELEKISAEARRFLDKRLHWDKDYYDILFTHAYYGLIKMPLCNGSVVSAYNKVSPFLLPFVEYDNVIEALRAVPYLGVGGKYQAKLMSSISPSLAALPSHYGGSFSGLGFKYYFWSRIKTLASAKKRDAMVLKKMLEKVNSPAAKKELNALNRLKVFSESMDALKNIDNRLNLKVALVESTQKRNVSLLGYFLRTYCE